MATIKELLVKFTGDTKSLENSMNRAKRATDKFSATTKKAGSATAAFGVAANNSAAGFNRIVVGGNRAKKAVRGFNDILTQSVFTIKNLIIVTAAFKALQMADQFTLLKARIDGSTEGIEESTKAWIGLKNISKATGADLGAAVDVFQRLSFVRKEIDATVDDMLQFTETVSQLGIVSGASTGALRAGLTQLGQGLSSGVLRAEEFNSILENIPAVGKAIAEEFGVTTGQLRNLVIDGKVLSEDVFQAILNQSEKVRAEFEKFPTTVGRAFANLKIRLGEAIGGINEATSATSGLIIVMEIAGKIITTIANLIKGFAGSINATFTIITTAITATILGAMKLIEKLVNVGIDALNKFRSEANQLERAEFAPQVDVNFLVAEGIKQAQKEATAGFESFKTGFEAGAGIFGVDFNDEIDKTKSNVVDLGDKYSKMGSVSAEATKAAERAMKKLEEQTIKNRTEMADFIFDSMKGFDSFRSLALKALDDIARSMVRLSMGGQAGGGLFEQIGASIFGGIGGLFGGATDITAPVGGSAFGGTDITAGFANGGSFKVGGDGATDSGIVAFKATRGEDVTVSKPNQTAASGGSGISITQNISIGAGVTGTVRQEIAKMLPDLKRATVQGVEDARMRNIIT